MGKIVFVDTVLIHLLQRKDNTSSPTVIQGVFVVYLCRKLVFVVIEGSHHGDDLLTQA